MMRRFIIVAALAASCLVVTGVAIAALSWAAVPSQTQAAPASLPASQSLAAPASIAASKGLAAPLAQQYAQETGITVSGEGIISVKPDQARVTLGVEISNPSAKQAQQGAAAAMDAVTRDLLGRGIEQKDIQTVRFDLSPEYDYSTRTAVLRGYRVTNMVAVTVRDITKLGDLLDGVVSQGATRIYGIGFSVSDPAAAGEQGREQAMNNARTKAEQLARLAGVTLGRPIRITETVSAPPMPVDLAPRMAAPAAGVATPISPGTQDVTTMVQVTYAIQ